MEAFFIKKLFMWGTRHVQEGFLQIDPIILCKFEKVSTI